MTLNDDEMESDDNQDLDDEELDEEFDDERFDEQFDDDFLQLLPGDARVLYDCILHSIKTNAGIGFKDHDQGRLIDIGVTEMPDEALGEVPVEYGLFTMLNRLAVIINKDSQSGVQGVTWPEFCEMAVDATRPK